MPADSQSAARVLVVDDEHEIATAIAEVLDYEGYAVACAYDGVHALEQIPRFRPNLILLDLMMPRMNGFELLDRLREEQDSTPVIVVSADQDYDASDLNVAAKVRKPFGIEQLLRAVTAALSNGASAYQS